VTPLKDLGLLSISALLPEAWERRLVDLNIQPLTLADVRIRGNSRYSTAARA
jgi:hypothetical protein